MQAPSYPSVCLALASVAITVWSIVRARPKWRFDRLALRGFDSPGPVPGPFRQAEPTLRPLYGLERDPGSAIIFTLHLLASVGGIVALSTVMWIAVAIVEGVPRAADSVAAVAGLFAAVLAVPMWLGNRMLHGMLGGVLALFLFGLWPPAVPLLLVIVIIQHDLIRRRAVADEREQTRRADHERRRNLPPTQPTDDARSRSRSSARSCSHNVVITSASTPTSSRAICSAVASTER